MELPLCSPSHLRASVFEESKRISRGGPCGSGVCEGSREVVLTYRVGVLKKVCFVRVSA